MRVVVFNSLNYDLRLEGLGDLSRCHILLLRLIAVNMKNVCCVLAVAWIVLVANSVFATDYHIKSQADFDKWKRHTFAAGDNIVFHRGKRFKGMFAPIGNGAKGAPIRISTCLLYTSPSPRDGLLSRMPSSA